jgi:hypothetical protein
VNSKLKYAVVSGVALILLEVASVFWQYNRAIVVITNRSGHDITDVTVNLQNTQATAGILNGQTIEIRVFPRGEAGFTLTFKTPELKTIVSPGQYIEAHGGYHVHMTINADYSISTKTKLVRGLVLLPILRRIRRLIR